MKIRTHIALDDQLAAQALPRVGIKTKKAAVEAALKASVSKPDYAGLLTLTGSGVLATDYDPDETYQRYPVEPSRLIEPRLKLTP